MEQRPGQGPRRARQGGVELSRAKRRLLCIGDSYTTGAGVPDSGSWPQLLAADLIGSGWPLSLQVVGRSGATAAELQNEVRAAGLRPPYDLVTVQAGVNDQYRGHGLDSFEADFQQLLSMAGLLAGDRPDTVLAVSIPDWSVTPHARDFDAAAVAASVDGFNRVARTVAEDWGCEWIDVTGCSRLAGGDPRMICTDGLHPSSGQYQRWIKVIRPPAERILRRTPP